MKRFQTLRSRFSSSIPNLFFASSLLIALLSLFACSSTQKATTANGAREYLAIRVYHTTDAAQLASIDQYLQASLLPALGGSGFDRVGVFTAIDNDTAKDKRMYVLVPLRTLPHLQQLADVTSQTLNTANAYVTAAHNTPPFSRFETIVLQSFEGMPVIKASGAQGQLAERVYELRSYESATEALHLNKVRMFNSGEVDLFQRLGFNAVFYGQVLSGSRMPNLMYMTSFASKAARDEHWKAFGSDPKWKQMSSDPQYQNNVSHIDISFLRPTSYSKL